MWWLLKAEQDMGTEKAKELGVSLVCRCYLSSWLSLGNNSDAPAWLYLQMRRVVAPSSLGSLATPGLMRETTKQQTGGLRKPNEDTLIQDRVMTTATVSLSTCHLRTGELEWFLTDLWLSCNFYMFRVTVLQWSFLFHLFQTDSNKDLPVKLTPFYVLTQGVIMWSWLA